MNKPGNGLAIAGGVLSIICGALMLLAGIYVLAVGGGMLAKLLPGGLVIILVITMGFGIPLIILGIGAIKGKAGQTLAGAILATVLAVLSLANIIGLILYVLTAVFMWIGWRQNIKVKAWNASQGAA
jgi:hypothetical protein